MRVSDLISGTPESSDWSNVKDDDSLFLDFPYKSEDKFDPSFCSSYVIFVPYAAHVSLYTALDTP